MKRWLVIVLTALAIGACAYKAQPVYDVDKALPPAAQNLPLDRVESLIMAGGAAYQWEFRRAEAGHLVATQRAPKFEAVVDIYFDQQRYRIVKQSAVGLRDTGTTIHSHYNTWIRNLEKGIDVQLAAGGARA
jgi:hypothetical protein